MVDDAVDVFAASILKIYRVFTESSTIHEARSSFLFCVRGITVFLVSEYMVILDWVINSSDAVVITIDCVFPLRISSGSRVIDVIFGPFD